MTIFNDKHHCLGRKNLIHKIDLTPSKQLQTLIENRRVFNLNNCELNIYESYQKAFGIPLAFQELVITSMVTGRKVMHLDHVPGLRISTRRDGDTACQSTHGDRLSGIYSSQADPMYRTYCELRIMFRIRWTISMNRYNSGSDDSHVWNIDFSQYHFSNDVEMAETINKIIRNCSSRDQAKNIYADLSLKELADPTCTESIPEAGGNG